MKTITFGEWARINRVKQGLTFQAVADAAGTSKSLIYETETGKTTPNLATAEKIAAALGYRLSEALAKCGR